MANRLNLSSKWTKQGPPGIRIPIMRFWLCAGLIILSTALVACSNAAAETQTPAPSLTANPTALPTQPPTPDPFLNYDEFIELMKVLPAEFENSSSSVSPDGRWVAIQTSRVGIRYGLYVYRFDQLMVASQVNDDEQLLYQVAEVNYEMSSRTPTVIQWSEKNNGFYYATRQFVDGAGLYPYFMDLSFYNPDSDDRIDLAVGLFGDLSISPDETLLTYLGFADRNARYLFISSLIDQSSQMMLIDLPCPEQSGGFVWSPDMSRIAFTVYHDHCPPYTREGPIILVADTDTLEMEIIHTAEEVALYTIEWNQDGILVEDDNETQWLLDPDTGEVSPAP